MRILKNIALVAKRELKRMTSRWLYFLVVLVFPLLSILLFGTLFRQGSPTGMPIAIVDLDHTATSRKMARAIDASPVLHITMYLQTEAGAMSQLRTGTIYGFVVLPKNLQSDILSARQPEISYYYHNSFLNAGGLMQNNLKLVLQTLSAGISIQKREAIGQERESIRAQVQPVQLNTHLLFNPTANYPVYICTIVLPIILQLLILLMTVYCIGIEIKERTSREWMRMSGKSIFTALAGKLLPYTLAFFTLMMFQNFVLYKLLQVPLNTGAGWLMLSSLLFVLAYQAIGVFCIGLLPVMRHALNMGAFYGILAFTLCGFSFPVDSMPSVSQFWAECFPVRHFMHIFQSQVLSGFELRYSLVSYLCLSLFVLLPLTILFRLKSSLIYQNFIETIHSS